ncbi:MAG: hypothetical protein IJK02_10495 [Clostridia bacterium]|nr:hypothetical protein [Clostridia bacterium]
MIRCPGCSAGLKFDIETQSMRCASCGGAYDPKLFDDERGGAQSVEMFNVHVFVCPSCGAELNTTDETDAVGYCPYCGGASLIYDRVRKLWKPDAIIPFKITKEQCKEAYIKEARRHPLVSKKYKDPSLIDAFRGIYMPYWKYTIEEKGPLSIKVSTASKRVGDYLYQDIFEIRSQVDSAFSGYSHDAASAFDDRIGDSLLPFDEKDERAFAPGYLSGFYADIGDIDKETYFDEAKDLFTDAQKSSLRRKVKGITAQKKKTERQKEVVEKKQINNLEAVDIPAAVSESRRVLYPVWFMSYRGKDSVTYAAVNGQTGEVVADFPLSPTKFVLLALAFSALSFAALAFLPSMKPVFAALIITAMFIFCSCWIRHIFKLLSLEDPAYEMIIKSKKKRRSFLDTLTAPIDKLDDYFYVHNVKPAVQNLLKIGLAFGIMIGLGLAALLIVIVVMVLKEMIPVSIGKVFAYLYCVIMTVLLLVKAYRFIKLQVLMARRRPPQFNKKGGDEDYEN